jgi:Fe-Mn family superoxide dismutase
MFEQVALQYGYSELEPHIDELTMVTHYTKHHTAYTNNLNAAVEKDSTLVGRSIEDILSSLQEIKDPALRSAVRNNGGGFFNHNLYFSILSPNAKIEPTGSLLARINTDFGSVDALKEELSKQALSRFGSGWAFLVASKDGSLKVVNTANQDNPIMEDKSVVSLIGIDVWEHAYYLKYKNLRAEYVKAFWNVLDWSKVEQRFNDLL